ncbi:MAG: lysophospholipid acyltransferase family protein [Candidatus Hodarchaeota archaeon]
MKDTIPFPQYETWMHKRIHVRHLTLKERFERWAKQPTFVRALDAVFSRAVRFFGWDTKGGRRAMYKFVIFWFRAYFKIFNRLKEIGKENIPKKGCIFLVNHPGSYDPPILFASVLKSHIPCGQVGIYASWGTGFFNDMIDVFYGMKSARGYGPETMSEKVERMVRQIITRNRFFAMWPEGHPHLGPIEQGFSSIVRVYSVVNKFEDRIPFVPVVIRGEGASRFGVSHKVGPIEIRYGKPVFVNRDWLKHPDEGGKTPREIIDHMMLIMARMNGQKKFAPNPRLESKKRFYKIKAEIEKDIERYKPPADVKPSDCEICKQLPQRTKIRTQVETQLKEYVDQLDEIMLGESIHRLRKCPKCGLVYEFWSRDDRTTLVRSNPERFYWVCVHLAADHGMTFVK